MKKFRFRYDIAVITGTITFITLSIVEINANFTWLGILLLVATGLVVISRMVVRK